MINLKNKAISGVKWTTVGTIGRSLFQLLQVVILARYLTKTEFGLVAIALFVVQFTNVFADMGMTSAILHRQEATNKEYSSIYWFNIFVSLFLYIILFFSAPWVSLFYKETEFLILVPIVGINILIMSAGRLHRTIMQKEFEFKSISIIELISYGLGLISAVVLVVNNYGIYSLVYSTLLSSLISNSLFIYKNIQKNPIYFHFKMDETKPFLKIGSFTMGSALLDFFSREIDILIIGKFLGAESVGVYSLAKQIILKLYNIINPILINVLSPLLSLMQTEKERLKKTYLKTINYLAYINAPIYLFVIISSKDILSILYGKDYESVYLVLSFMAFSYYLFSIGNPVGSLQIATGKTDIGFKWTIFRILVTVPVIFVGSLISVEAVAGFYSLLALFLIIPGWFMQLKPMANIKLKEYFLQFYIFHILVIIGILITFVFDGINITNIIIIDLIIKFLFIIVIYCTFVFIFDRKIMLEIINILKTQINLINKKD